MTIQSRSAKDIFVEFIGKVPPDEWNDRLDDVCQNDEVLRRRVQALLRAHAEAGSFLNEPALEIDITINDGTSFAERPGSVIGPYKLLEQIGEGGFGVVFLAEQTRPVRREVALKVIKAGMDTKEVVARFEAERQALAMMDHPNIAKVLGGGATDSGRPYFAMELVPGIPINEYCDQCKLTTRERLELFVMVCKAVQHAHQKGVIHRDLKPSNVLIAIQDGVPTPKIIDFGVAKSTGQRLTEQTLRTRFAQIVGTPLYMSPEQAELNPLGVDTRSDIYSLGVLLYELLTGTTPFEKERLHSASFDELRDIICHEEPPRPSTRLSTLAGEVAKTVAACHRTESRHLVQTVRGDLDWIVLKSMEKDRTRRYESASSLGRDVERYLRDEPVEACPPSTGYRVHKFVRRNKAAIATLALVAAALLTGAGVASWQAVRATKERDRAISAEGLAAAEAARSEQVAQFLKDMLAAAGPSVARGRDATLLREVLDNTSKRVERDLANQPEIQGDMWSTLGTTYQDIDDHREAVESFERAVKCYRIEPGAPNGKLAVVLARLGFSHSFLKDLAIGKRNAEAGLKMARLVGDKEALATCLCYRARASNEFGMASNEAIPYLEEALKLYREFGDRPIAEAECIRHLAACLADDDKHRAESLARHAHEILREHLGPDDPRILSVKWLLGQIVLLQGKPAEAEPLLRDTLDRWELVYDQEHPHRYVVRNHLATSLALQNHWDEAREVIEGAPPTTYARELQYRDFYKRVFDILARQGRVDDANTVLEEVQQRLSDVRSTYGPDHFYTKNYQSILADMVEQMDKAKRARQKRDKANRRTSDNDAEDDNAPQPKSDAARVPGIEQLSVSDSTTDN